LLRAIHRRAGTTGRPACSASIDLAIRRVDAADSNQKARPNQERDGNHA
jgi:hypothetical protein